MYELTNFGFLKEKIIAFLRKMTLNFRKK